MASGYLHGRYIILTGANDITLQERVDVFNLIQSACCPFPMFFLAGSYSYINLLLFHSILDIDLFSILLKVLMSDSRDKLLPGE